MIYVGSRSRCASSSPNTEKSSCASTHAQAPSLERAFHCKLFKKAPFVKVRSMVRKRIANTVNVNFHFPMSNLISHLFRCCTLLHIMLFGVLLLFQGFSSWLGTVKVKEMCFISTAVSFQSFQQCFCFKNSTEPINYSSSDPDSKVRVVVGATAVTDVAERTHLVAVAKQK